MTIYKKVKNISPENAAYIAGLIDGEGTISLSRKHKGDNRQLVISISNNELPLLKYIHKTVGAGHITRKRNYSILHAPSFTYVITNRQALTLLECISSYLKTYKSKRAKFILKDYLRLTPRNGRYTSDQKKKREIFIEKFLKIKVRGVTLVDYRNDLMR